MSGPASPTATTSLSSSEIISMIKKGTVGGRVFRDP